jgi:ABC-type cobalamin/Fe3+-siderophores transport system ATPase subunit
VTGVVAVIAVTGPSAAGKTTLAQTLAAHLPGTVHLQQDAYFRDPDDYPPDANFCDHRWLHLDAFLDAFRALSAGGTALVPDMDFATFRPRGHRLLGPARHLIVDGMTRVCRSPSCPRGRVEVQPARCRQVAGWVSSIADAAAARTCATASRNPSRVGAWTLTYTPTRNSRTSPAASRCASASASPTVT